MQAGSVGRARASRRSWQRERSPRQPGDDVGRAANAAVMVSGSTVDAAGNYVEGSSTRSTRRAGVDVGRLRQSTAHVRHPAGRTAPTSCEFYPSLGVHAASGTATRPTWRRPTSSPSPAPRRPWRPGPSSAARASTGVVRTADGRAVRSAHRHARTTPPPATRSAATRPTATAPSASAPPPPSVKLRLQRLRPRQRRPLATEWYNDKATLATADAVAPTAAGADVGVVTLAPGGSISGRVTNDVRRARSTAPRSCASTAAATTPTPTASTSIEGVDTGEHVVSLLRPDRRVRRRVLEQRPARQLRPPPTPVTVAPGQAVTGIDAALAAAPAAAPNGVDVSGTVRDELGNIGVGYRDRALRHPGRPATTAKVVATTYSNRAGQYHFTAARPHRRRDRVQDRGRGRAGAPRGGRLRSAARRGRATSSATTPPPPSPPRRAPSTSPCRSPVA